MLYVSTRNIANRFSASDVLQADFAPDGGAFVPLVLPEFSEKDILKLRENSFAETVSLLLNLFFDTDLNAWDVEFCVGRYPYKFTALHHRLYIAEVWNNLASSYEYFEKGLYEKLTENCAGNGQPTHWAKIVIQIAVLFGLFSELLRRSVHEADVCVQADTFISPVSAWYANAMGLPLKKIICAASANHVFWDLVHRGECITGTIAANPYLNAGVESLLYDIYGSQEAERFALCVSRRSIYILPDGDKERFMKAFYVSVVSDSRVAATVRSIYQIHQYFTAPMAAQVFSGLQDYRARTGESRNALLLSLSSPVFHTQMLSKVLGISLQEIESMIDKA